MGLQSATTQVKVRNLQRKLYLVSKQKPDYRFYSLYDKLYRKDILEEAYKRCKANKGAPGVDGKSFEDVEEQGKEEFLQDIAESLRSRTYVPAPTRRVLIPKPDGRARPLGIACVRDRVVQTACKLVIEPIFEPGLHEGSFGYRPKKNAHGAIQAIESYIKQGFVHVYDADLSGYFDSIPHQRLIDKISVKISDKQLLAFVRKILKSPIQVTDKRGAVRYTGNHEGVPQGSPLSPVLANVYLNDFSRKIASSTPCKIITYADDFVILHKRPYNDRQLLWFSALLKSEGLTINQAKTKVVAMDKLGSEFTFVGFSFKRIKGFYRGTTYVKIQPSKRSQENFKEAIRAIVKHRTSLTLAELIKRCNWVIRGWRNYFAPVGFPRNVFFKLDWFVVARFYRWSKRLSQRRSKRFAQNAWGILKANGLIMLQPVAPKL